jgi:hypothetical protein
MLVFHLYLQIVFVSTENMAQKGTEREREGGREGERERGEGERERK